MNRFRPLYRPTRAAFSAFELMTAVVIGSILATLAYGGFRAYERQLPVRHSAQRLTHAMRAARSFAVNNGANPYAVQIDLDQRIFWVDEINDAGATLTPKVVRPESFDAQVNVESIYVGIVPYPANQVTIRFFADGSSDDFSVFLNRKAGSATDERQFSTVRLYGPTGVAKVYHGQRLAPSIKPTIEPL